MIWPMVPSAAAKPQSGCLWGRFSRKCRAPASSRSQPVEVAGERPIQIGVHDLAHRAIGGGEAPERLFVGEIFAEVQGAGVVEIVVETGGAQGAGEGGEQVGGGGFVIPDVGG